jgi:hypothetical protein
MENAPEHALERLVLKRGTERRCERVRAPEIKQNFASWKLAWIPLEQEKLEKEVRTPGSSCGRGEGERKKVNTASLPKFHDWSLFLQRRKKVSELGNGCIEIWLFCHVSGTRRRGEVLAYEEFSANETVHVSGVTYRPRRAAVASHQL